MFENPEIALDELPGTEEIDWQSMDPGYLKRLRVNVAIGMAIPFIINTGVIFEASFEPWRLVIPYAFLAVLTVLILLWTGVAVKRRGYVVRDKDMLFKKGVIWRSVTAVPFNRIQHVETSNTPLDRRFGIATLKLFTAGGSGGDLKIDGLAADTAEQLRLYILKKTGASIEES